MVLDFYVTESKMRWFHKQSEAIEHCKEKGENEHGLFVLHKFNGNRKFCAIKYDEFARLYLSFHIDLCHYDEVIIEGLPSKLYLDIDVENQEYVESKGCLIVETLIRYISHCLVVMYGVQCDRSNIIQLESSSESKFSQHLIYPQVIFKNNFECGNFIKEISFAAADALEGTSFGRTVLGFPTTDLKQLFYDSGTNKNRFLADLTVYSKNRQFRLLRSSKLGKEEHLIAAEDNQYPVLSEEQFFLDSLITRTMGSNSQHFLTCEPPNEKACWNEGIEQNPLPTPPFAHKATFPHKDLDAFVLTCIQKIEQQKATTIHSIVHAKSGLCVAYTLSGPKWCQNVQREHRNNHPYFVANMKTGQVYQKCFSFPCRGYRSEPTNIPVDIIGRFHLGNEDELLQQLLATDDEMIQQVERLN